MLLIFLLVCLFKTYEAQYRDERCKCIFPCPPPPNSTLSPKNFRQIYIGNIPASKCNCIDVRSIVIFYKEIQHCSKCECKYQYRNTFTIKVVVIFIISLLSSLFLYMLFLLCLDPMINKPSPDFYTEYHNEGDDSTAIINYRSGGISHSMGIYDNVFCRVGLHKDKWKGQVQEQRKNVFDKHTMLN
ncbi:unnamed protein product [Gordionus sp. m RMFG-2023]|uniref:putative protein 2 n=1 Tax=Gordionus sp. m RMFG-2023 TaxID=3053472 RepID=UPI0030DF71BB